MILSQRCVCGHPKYMHSPLLRPDGSREDGLDGSYRKGPRGQSAKESGCAKPIDPCTLVENDVRCTCGFYQKVAA